MELGAREGIEEEDALKVMKLIIGGYSEEDFGSWMSYNDFQQKKVEF